MRKIVIQNGKVVSATGELPYDVIADFSESNDDDNGESNKESITKTDSKTNIKLEATSGMIPDNATMNIVEISSGEDFEKIKNVLDGIKNFKAYDITLKSDDTNIKPQGKVKISIPIPVGFDTSNLIVYGIEKDGTKTEYQVKVADGYATFETDTFSTYVLGEKVSNETQNNGNSNTGETTTENNDTKLPQTGEETNTFATGLSIAIIAGIFWLVSMLLIDREKKKINQEQKGSKHND